MVHSTGRDLFDFAKDRERVFDQIAAELAKVDPDLTFEIRPKEPARDFVISAAGMKRAFPAVVGLSTAAPRSPRQVEGHCLSSAAAASDY
jgi:hypothetical protein